MGFTWSTLILETINFLVVVWLLKRLLYAPVLNAIAKRQEAIRKDLAEAQTAKAQALEWEKTYEGRLCGWETEKAAKQVELERELEAQRARALRAVENELAKERAKQKVLEEGRMLELVRQKEEEALDLAAHFCSRLLVRVASSDLENKIIAIFLEDIFKLPEEKARELKNGFKNHAQAAVDIKTAFSLNDEQKQSLSSALVRLLGAPVPCQFTQDPALIAGVSVAMGPLVLQANLCDELHLFAAVDRHVQ